MADPLGCRRLRAGLGVGGLDVGASETSYGGGRIKDGPSGRVRFGGRRIGAISGLSGGLVQGGSVIRNLIESDKPYRLRGLTRDASKPGALALKELGVEVVSVTVAPGNEAAVRKAFEGAEVVFVSPIAGAVLSLTSSGKAMTDFWEHIDPAREIAEGKLMVDAAKAAGVKLLVWSGLEDVTKGSGGRYTHVYHFDSKAAVTAYAHSQLPTVDVQAGFYMTNLGDPNVALRQEKDGSYIWEHPSAGAPLPVPYIDMARDYGLFVCYAIETPAYRAGGKAIYSYGERITHAQAAETLRRMRGTTARVHPLPMEAYQEAIKAKGAPALVLADMADMNFMAEYGYYFNKELSDEQQKVREGLARRPRTFEEFLRANPDFLKE